MMIKNVVITNGQLLSVLYRGDLALGPLLPKQKNPHFHSVVSDTQMPHLSWNMDVQNDSYR